MSGKPRPAGFMTVTMDGLQKRAFERLAGEGIRFDYPMNRLTSYRVGGPVEALWEAHNLTMLKKVIRYLVSEGIPYGVLGRGSNLLVTDKGIEGVMILLKGSLALVSEGTEDGFVYAGGGVHLAHLMNWCGQRGVSGLEFLAGIPGTVGGAVAMNAGAFQREINQRIRTVQMVTPEGEQVEMDRSKLEFSYRRFHMKEGTVITHTGFDLIRSRRQVVLDKMGGFLKTRKETQPLEYPSAGSVFKNPTGDFAGRLIEKAGLKGKSVGGAMVSEKHANYIVNTGNATAADILSLLDLVKREVKRTLGVDLEPEIKILGKRDNSPL